MATQPIETYITILEKWSLSPINSTFLSAPGREDLSYEAAHSFTTRIASELVNKGVNSGIKVALIIPDSPEMVVCSLLVGSVATACPLNYGETLSSYKQIFSLLKPDLIIIGDGINSDAKLAAQESNCAVAHLRPNLEAAAGIFTLEASKLHNHPPNNLLKNYNLILQTSGSTGTPKFVPHTAKALIKSATAAANVFSLGRSDTELLMNPLFHALGFATGVLLPLVSGGQIVSCGNFQTSEFGTWLKRYQPTWYATGPTIHRKIASIINSIPSDSFKSLRFVRSASAPLDPGFIRELEAKMGVTLINAYGLSEVVHVTCTNTETTKVGSVGHTVLPEITILDEIGNQLQANQSGEISLRGETLLHNYLSELNGQQKYLNNWFRTGDLGYLDDENYLHITGRIKDIINKGGTKIMPLEIDQILSSHSDVLDAQCFSIPHSSLGETIAAAVILCKTATVNEQELKEIVRRQLGEIKVPNRILFVDSFPTGTTGKQIRRALYKQLKERLNSTQESLHGEYQSAVAESFKKALKVEAIYSDSHFFLLGGDSLSALTVLSSLEKRFNKEIPLSILFEYPEVAAFAEKIERLPERNKTTIGDIQLTHPKALIRLEKGNSNTVVVMIHGMGGELFCYNDVRKGLIDIECVGLQALEHSGGQKATSIEEMCTSYAHELYETYPQRPMVLCGYSLGGMLAFETARQAKKLGANISEVIVLDTHLRNLPFIVHWTSVCLYILKRLPSHVNKVIRQPKKLLNLKGKLIKVKRILPFSEKKIAYTNNSNSHRHTSHTIDHYKQLSLTFNPSPDSISVTLMRSMTHTSKAALRPRWYYLCRGKLSVVSIELNHLEMLNDQGSQFLTNLLLKKVALQNKSTVSEKSTKKTFS